MAAVPVRARCGLQKRAPFHRDAPPEKRVHPTWTAQGSKELAGAAAARAKARLTGCGRCRRMGTTRRAGMKASLRGCAHRHRDLRRRRADRRRRHRRRGLDGAARAARDLLRHDRRAGRPGAARRRRHGDGRCGLSQRAALRRVHRVRRPGMARAGAQSRDARFSEIPPPRGDRVGLHRRAHPRGRRHARRPARHDPARRGRRGDRFAALADPGLRQGRHAASEPRGGRPGRGHQRRRVARDRRHALSHRTDLRRGRARRGRESHRIRSCRERRPACRGSARRSGRPRSPGRGRRPPARPRRDPPRRRWGDERRQPAVGHPARRGATRTGRRPRATRRGGPAAAGPAGPRSGSVHRRARRRRRTSTCAAPSSASSNHFARSPRSTPNAWCSTPSATPSPNAGSSRPPDITASVASSLASTIGLRPGSTSTLIPNFRRDVRPAAYAIATTGSGASPLIRSDNHRLSKPNRSMVSTTCAVLGALQSGPRAQPDADPHLHLGHGAA